MEFIEVAPMPGEFIYQLQSSCGQVDLGVAPVIFGYRVRAGFADDFHYNLDYCAGPEQRQVQLLFDLVKAILSQQPYSPRLFDIFPRQDIKPIFRDPECFTKLWHLYHAPTGDQPAFVSHPLPYLDPLKCQYLANLYAYTSPVARTT